MYKNPPSFPRNGIVGEWAGVILSFQMQIILYVFCYCGVRVCTVYVWYSTSSRFTLILIKFC